MGGGESGGPPGQPLGTPNCFRCRHFEVRHDPAWPYGCRAFDFRSRALPSQEVQRSSGAPCQGFEPRDPTPRPPPRTPRDPGGIYG